MCCFLIFYLKRIAHKTNVLNSTLRITSYKELLIIACKKILVADKKASFLRLAKLEKCEFTVVNDHFESECNEKNGVFLLTNYCKIA
jgi:hypothetical protein